MFEFDGFIYFGYLFSWYLQIILDVIYLYN